MRERETALHLASFLRRFSEPLIDQCALWGSRRERHRISPPYLTTKLPSLWITLSTSWKWCSSQPLGNSCSEERGYSFKYDQESSHRSHASCEVKSIGWKCQVNDASNEVESEEWGRSCPETWWISSALWGGGQPGRGSSVDRVPCLELWEVITRLEQKIWAEVCILTQIIASSNLSVKLWRPPFMDLEISLCVSAFACQAQIFPRGKRQVVPHFPFLNSVHAAWETGFLGPHTSVGLPPLSVFSNFQICQTGADTGGY